LGDFCPPKGLGLLGVKCHYLFYSRSSNSWDLLYYGDLFTYGRCTYRILLYLEIFPWIIVSHASNSTPISNAGSALFAWKWKKSYCYCSIDDYARVHWMGLEISRPGFQDFCIQFTTQLISWNLLKDPPLTNAWNKYGSHPPY